MSLSQAEETALIEAVRRVAKSEIVPRFRSLDANEVDTKSAADDLVTVADHASERELTKAVNDIMPDARVVGEEAVSENKDLLDQVAATGRTVIIDPIDGTWNYANGVATYGVIVAVLDGGETVFGLLYDPVCDDWVMARRGGGAWFVQPGKGQKRLQLQPKSEPLDDRFGFLALYLYKGEERAKLAQSMARFQRTVSLRCSCHEYRLATMGRAAFSLNGMLNVWDHAAGVLCFTEAGGVARLLNGEDYRTDLRDGRILLAESEDLWTELSDYWSFLAKG